MRMKGPDGSFSVSEIAMDGPDNMERYKMMKEEAIEEEEQK